MPLQQTVFAKGTRSEIQTSSRQHGEGNIDLGGIGELLREARERKGLSLGEVSDSLFLTKSTLDAIESGRWEVLPHPVYVKGYVKSYADYLDVHQRIEERLHPVEASKNNGRDVTPAAHDMESVTERNRTPCFRQLPLRRLALRCSFVVGLAFGMTTSASSGLQQTSSGCLNDIVAALQAVATSL